MSQFHRDQASDSNEVVIPLMLDGTYPMITPGLDWTRLFMSLTAGAGTRCMSLLPQSPTLWLDRKKTPSAHASVVKLSFLWTRFVNEVIIPKRPKEGLDLDDPRTDRS